MDLFVRYCALVRPLDNAGRLQLAVRHSYIINEDFSSFTWFHNLLFLQKKADMAQLEAGQPCLFFCMKFIVCVDCGF